MSWCKKCVKTNVKEYHKTHKRKSYHWTEKSKIAKAKYREKNRILLRQKNKEYQRKNPKKILARVRVYQAKKRSATPKWGNRKGIVEIYINCPAGMDVDHIFPLNGKTVSGLHVSWNLQYLESSENKKKSNKIS